MTESITKEELKRLSPLSQDDNIKYMNEELFYFDEALKMMKYNVNLFNYSPKSLKEKTIKLDLLLKYRNKLKPYLPHSYGLFTLNDLSPYIVDWSWREEFEDRQIHSLDLERRLATYYTVDCCLYEPNGNSIEFSIRFSSRELYRFLTEIEDYTSKDDTPYDDRPYPAHRLTKYSPKIRKLLTHKAQDPFTQKEEQFRLHIIIPEVEVDANPQDEPTNADTEETNTDNHTSCAWMEPSDKPTSRIRSALVLLGIIGLITFCAGFWPGVLITAICILSNLASSAIDDNNQYIPSQQLR